MQVTPQADRTPAPGDPTPGPKPEGASLKKLAVHSSHYLLGVVGTFLVGLVSFPVLTRTFSVADYGTLDIVSKVLLFVTAVSKLGIQHAALRLFCENNADEEQRRRYFTTIAGGLAAACGLGAASLFIFAWLTAGSLLEPALASFLGLSSVLIFARGIYSAQLAFLRVEEKTGAFNRAMFGARVSMVATVILLLKLGKPTVTYYFIGVIISEFAVVAILLLPLIRRGAFARASFDRELLESSIRLGVPLAAYEVALSAFNTSDRFMVRYFLGAEASGYYSVAQGLAQQANDCLLNPLTLALMPIYLRIWAEEGAEKTAEFLSTAFKWYVFAACGILAIVGASSLDVVGLLASARYVTAARLLPIMLAGLLVYAAQHFLCAGLLIHKKTGTMAGMLFLAAIGNAVLNAILLPLFGLSGATAASVLTYTCWMAFLARVSFQKFSFPVDKLALVKFAAAGALGYAAGSYFQAGNILVRLGGKVISAAVIYVALSYLLDGEVRRIVRKVPEWIGPRLRSLTAA